MVVQGTVQGGTRQYVLVCTGMYNFDISRTASYPSPEEDVLVCTSTYHLVLPRTRGTGFQMPSRTESARGWCL